MSLLDMIGPVMIGPSSSHTAGACRIGLIARHLLGHRPESAVIGLHASFAKTGRGHGTHLALVAGLLGFAPDDPRLPRAFEEAQAAGLAFTFEDVDLGDVHPNTARLRVTGGGGSADVTASSTGGGAIEVVRVDGFRVQFTGASPTLLTRYTDAIGIIARVASLIASDGVNIATLNCTREKRGGAAMLSIELDAPLSDEAVRMLSRWPEMAWIRMLPKVMDG
ncbi:L-serine ammonia-lyase, iron-sulfur-dependent subunit beta [Deinococcus maricopensis]|uniref:L-serine dehydratase n=1 Tax=Deinococcus maricopensis (strain DSM 21211 / LMG 22137 / NRRL B-23946 / LB-34) TaxID=709986 RepID=E8U838_DEIML|nr:L-serine ammonia-lyase, iron-sulfur-dependent subunit beta [Deinococcus maricopensis]ADV67227.1 L-serine dehydratase, iron-sulfur-dependent, beta subunit [Deinococcus maricopensis DSM 21211]